MNEKKEKENKRKKERRNLLYEGFSLVVYFDQQTHACACIRMVENDQKHSKMSKKYLFHHAYKRQPRGLQIKTKKKFVGQRLGVIPKIWLTP